jgi:hypothetical protein
METRTQHPEAVQTPVPIQFRKTSSPEHAIFRKEGEYWTLGHGDKSFRLKDTKGLGYLAPICCVIPGSNSMCSTSWVELRASRRSAKPVR